MRNNQPVTQQEYLLRDGIMIVSKTDLKGRITYVNDDFLEASGFTNDELIGQPHNLVRHPDMPPEAFEDLWRTLKAGKPWTGLVKTRRKNGDHYWVVANATPITEGGHVTGYLSVRGRPERAQVAAAEDAYRMFREGRAGSFAIREGGVVANGLLAKLNFVKRGMDRASLAQKFLAIGLLCLLPILIGTTQLAVSFREGIAASQKERDGLAYHAAARGFLQDVQKHRGLASTFLSGDKSFAEPLAAKKRDIDAHVKALDALDARFAKDFDLRGTWGGVRANWTKLLGEYKGLAATESAKRHTALVAELLALMAQVGDGSGLILDPELDSFHVMDLLVNRLPTLVEKLGQGRAFGVIAVAQKTPDFEAKKPLLTLHGMAVGIQEDIARGQASLEGANAGLRMKLATAVDDSGNATKSFLSLLDRQVLTPARIEIEPKQFIAQATTAIDSSYALYDAAAPALEGLLSARIQRMQTKMWVSLAGVLALAAAAFGVTLVVLRSLSRQLGAAAAHFDRVAQGHFDNLIEVKGNDEVAKLMYALRGCQTRLGFDLEETRRRAAETARIKSALDVAATNVMVADAEYRITYTNQSLAAMLATAEADIRKDLPAFAAQKVLGSSIDVFHKDPA